ASIVTNTNQNNNNDYLISPQIYVPDDETTTLLTYKYEVTAWNDGDQTSYSVKASNTGMGEDNFIYEIQPTTIISNTTWEEVTYELPEDLTGDVNIAWIIEPAPDSGPDSQSTFRLSISDVHIYQDCAAPSDLNVEDMTETSALLTWVPADETDDTCEDRK